MMLRLLRFLIRILLKLIARFEIRGKENVPLSGGMVIAAASLLNANPKPSRQDIIAGMDGHLCRCGTHPRIIRAIENPHVTMLGHLTGRLLLQRPGYEVDVPAIIDAAAETGTIIEINANPWRLDMDWRWWKLAREKGVKTSINPDAHSTRGLQDVFFGIRVARKGWLTKADVINTLPLAKLEKELAKKRAKR